MSVHGEYSRALESVIATVQMLEEPARAECLSKLHAARLAENPDLTTAAGAAREALGTLALRAQKSGRLSETSRRLELHCAAILGSPATEPV